MTLLPLRRRRAESWRTPVGAIAGTVAVLLCPPGGTTTARAQLVATVVASGLSRPVAFVQDPLDPTVRYVVEQGGRIRVVEDGLLLPTDFLDLTQAVTSTGERGLLGLAFPPDAATTGRCFVNFTNTSGHTVIARFTRSPGNPHVADPASRFDLQWPSGLRHIVQPFVNHNGGTLRFGPDGHLYVGMGDGGSGSDPGHRAQDPTTLLGKMLRIDVAVPDTDVRGYRIPPDNPFVDGNPVAALGEIWAFGLRNPWKFSFDDPAHGGTGALLIGDVGQNAWEEIDYEPALAGGRNYGWRNREGRHDHVTSQPPAFGPLVDPVHEYDRRIGFSVTGGHVYRGSALHGRHLGRYFFSDFGSGRVISLGLAIDPVTGEASVVDQTDHTTELGGSNVLGNVSSVDAITGGELCLTSYSAGRVLCLGDTTGDEDSDGLPTTWEQRFGLDPLSAAGENGASGDPDADGKSNAQELADGTHPRGFAQLTRFFAEGAAGGALVEFETILATLNPGTAVARVLYRFLKTDGTVVSHFITLAGRTRHTLEAGAVSGLAPAEFSTIIETDAEVVTNRVVRWNPATAYGSHAETGIASPATTWYLAEGSTNGFDLFYLIQNFSGDPTTVRVTFLLPGGVAPVMRTYTIAPTSRHNIWVNAEAASLPELLATDVSAVLESLDGTPIIVERAMYLNLPGQVFGAGHGSAGVTEPATSWFLAEGATGGFFDLFVLISNPNPVAVPVRADYLLPDGATVSRTYTVAPRSRFNVWVDFEDPRLTHTAVSTTLTSLSGLAFIAERSMWFPGPPARWAEAHGSPGSTVPGTRWGVAAGEVGGVRNVFTFVLIANTAAVPESVRLTLLFEDGTAVEKTFALAPRSRFNVDVAAEFPTATDRRFGVLVEGLGGGPASLVVEWSAYWSATTPDPLAWDSGVSALATRLD